MPNDRKTMYPDDGGLKEPVREFGEGFNAFQMIRDHFAPKDRAMTPSELLACPFCHGDPDVHDYDDDWWRVICPCTVHGPLRRTEAEAITAWNQRSTPTELRDAATAYELGMAAGIRSQQEHAARQAELGDDLVIELERIAYELIDQQNEPWTEGNGLSHNRIHFWRDKAIGCSQAIRAFLLARKTSACIQGDSP